MDRIELTIFWKGEKYTFAVLTVNEWTLKKLYKIMLKTLYRLKAKGLGDDAEKIANG